ncbi:MAG: ACP phosphodiesterase [Chromatiales bacterium]|nr:ACP phosphodiesterase [Chromatiales bacterium]
MAGPVPEHRLGGLIADFVRGRIEMLAQSYPEPVLQGIIEHRKIDSFTDAHPLFLASRARISPSRRRVAGIIVDLAYDHLLSKHWQRFSDEPKAKFIQSVYQLLQDNHALLPERLQSMVPAMIAHDWLGSYEKLATLGLAFDRMSMRMKRTDALIGALGEVEREYEHLEKDFLAFFPEAITFTQTIRE